jgi:hypothetical protein
MHAYQFTVLIEDVIKDIDKQVERCMGQGLERGTNP